MKNSNSSQSFKKTKSLSPNLIQDNTNIDKVRIKFSKKDTLCFIGHLDFLRVFQQTIRRSGLPIAYSQGFNPHQILSFALPLPLGMTSINDYADITLTEPIDNDEIILRLNANAPQGLVFHAVYKPYGKPAAAATVVADYTVNTVISKEIENAIESLMACKTFIIPKKTKSGIKDTDIRPDIFNIEIVENGIKLVLSAGSGRFLNPLLVAEQILTIPPCNSMMSRTELYQDINGELLPL